MTLTGLLSQTVTVRRWSAGAKDARGERTPVFDAGTEYQARLEQQPGEEVTAGRDTLLADWRLFLPAGAVVGGRDRVVDEDGRVFEVVGPPQRHRTPAGVHHIEARLRHVEG